MRGGYGWLLRAIPKLVPFFSDSLEAATPLGTPYGAIKLDVTEHYLLLFIWLMMFRACFVIISPAPSARFVPRPDS